MALKIQYCSDLHLEMQRGRRPAAGVPFLEDLKETDADVLVLAGDIDTKLRGVDWAIGQAKRMAKPVLYVFGNHEFYGANLPGLLDKARARTEGNGVRILEKDACTIGATRFLGCTVWTDYQLHQSLSRSTGSAKAFITDFRKIRFGPDYRRLDPYKLLSLHADAVDWLERRLSESHTGKTVVVTHHAPSLESIPLHRHDDMLSAAYASDLSRLMNLGVDCWIHGHVHSPSDYWVGATHVIANPRGYYPTDLCVAFDPRAVVDLTLSRPVQNVGF